MTFKDKIVLVTGGCGFIGSHLCDEIIKHDPQKLIIFDNLCQSIVDNIKHLLNDSRVEFIRGDIRDYEVIEPHVLVSDYVFHLVASNMGTSEFRPRLDLETNIIGTFNVLTAARKNPKVRIVHASSGSVLGSSNTPMVEDSIMRPTTPYAISKMCGEKYVKFFADEHKVKASIIRYHHVYGPRQDSHGKSGVVNIFLTRILQNQPPCIWGTGKQIKCFTYVKDVVNATIMLSQRDETIGEIYNVASDDRVTIQELADLLISKYAQDKNMKPTRGSAKVGENMSPYPDTTKIKKLGWRAMYTLEQGLGASKVWVEEQLKK